MQPSQGLVGVLDLHHDAQVDLIAPLADHFDVDNGNVEQALFQA